MPRHTHRKIARKQEQYQRAARERQLETLLEALRRQWAAQA